MSEDKIQHLGRRRHFHEKDEQSGFSFFRLRVDVEISYATDLFEISSRSMDVQLTYSHIILCSIKTKERIALVIDERWTKVDGSVFKFGFVELHQNCHRSDASGFGFDVERGATFAVGGARVDAVGDQIRDDARGGIVQEG